MPAWRKGQSGNPKGRPPKGLALTDILRELIEQPTKVSSTHRHAGKTYKQAIIDELLNKAVEGEEWAIKMVYERLEGKPAQPLVGPSPDEPVEIAIKFV